MFKTFMSPDFLTKFLEEYRELPVLWQVRSADYSKRANRDEAWDFLVQFTREKLPDADCVLLTCLDVLILDTEMYEQSSESAHACVVKYIRARVASQARRAGLASQTRTFRGTFRPRSRCDQQLLYTAS
jgi:hypothetical protein